MKARVYLIVSKGGVEKLVKTTNFELGPGQLAVPLELNVADELFSPTLLPVVHLEIPREALARQAVSSVALRPELPAPQKLERR